MVKMGKGRARRKRLPVMFSLLIFFTLVLTILLSGLLAFLLSRSGFLVEHNWWAVLGGVALASGLMGTALSRFVGRHPLSTIADISQATKAMAKGDFQVRIREDIAIDELREMARSFNRMAGELASTELLRNDFIENVSHEFKTPLSAIEGYAALLQKPGLTEEKRREYTRKILHNTRRLSALTGNILLLSRLESQGLNVSTGWFCLDEQLREAILSLEEGWTAKELDLDIQLDSADCWGNKDLLAHVWQNLLSNAVKFAPQKGAVRVLLRRDEGGLAVAIEDNGPGMTQEVQCRVFEKFYQGDTTRSTEGNGLGLALAKRIVDLHKGGITVDSKAGHGARFTVRLPADGGC